MRIQSAETGSSAAFGTLYLLARKRVYNLAYRMLGSADDAEDVAQEAYLRAWSGYIRYDPSRSFDAWILRITYNLCIDQLRRRRRKQELSLDTPVVTQPDERAHSIELLDHSDGPAERLLAHEMDESLQLALGSLPPVYLRCMLLLEQEHSYAEMAAMLHCPVGTVRSRVNRARARLRQAISGPQHQRLTPLERRDGGALS